MTLFFDVAKKAIVDVLRAGRDAEISADMGMVNQGINFLKGIGLSGVLHKVGRDPKISAAKQKELEDCMTAVTQAANQANDEENYKILSTRINTCILNVQKLSPGDFTTSIAWIAASKAQAVLLTIRQDFIDTNLLDKSSEPADPLGQFQKAITKYFASSAVHVTELSKAKNDAAKSALQNCASTVEDTKEEKKDAIKKRVEENIGFLRTANGKLCEESGYDIFWPLPGLSVGQLTLGSMFGWKKSFQPSEGTLGECCDEAEAAVDPEKATRGSASKGP